MRPSRRGARPEWRGQMKPGMIRKGLVALAALAVLGLAIVLALPLIASTQIVRDRIAQELSALSGYRVTISEAPEVSVWPVVRARLEDVTFTDWAEPEAAPAIEAESIELDLSAWAAMRGEIVFSRLVLMRPLVRLQDEDGEGLAFDAPSGGRIMRALNSARESLAATPDQRPPASDLSGASVGLIEFREGRAIAAGDQDRPILTSVSGRFDWPSLTSAARLEATAIWRGEAVTVEGASAQPLDLVSGLPAPLRISLTSEPANLSFEGQVIAGAQPFIDGRATTSFPSLKRLVEWSDLSLRGLPPLSPVSIAGTIEGNLERLRIEGADVELGSSRGSGRLEMSLAADVPGISGTLAFASLNLRPLMAAFSPAAAGTAGMSDPVETGLVGRLNLDIRLSAATASLGTLALSDVAAAMQARDGIASLDISDATAFGGVIQAGLRIDTNPTLNAVELKILAEDIDAGAMAVAGEIRRVVPQAPADLSVIARGAGADWAAVLADAEGSISVTLGEGTILGLDMQGFTTRAGEGRFFALSEVETGQLAIRSASARAQIDNGVLRLERSVIDLGDRTFSFEGIVPYMGRALALSGGLTPKAEDSTAPNLRFFIGGGWDAPYVSPVVEQADF